MGYYLAVDIGGTQLRAALFTPDSHEPKVISRFKTQNVSRDDKGDSPLERLQALISSIWPEDEEVLAISVAAPGPTNPYTGVIVEAPNIPGWVNIPLRQILQERFHTPVLLGNDANLAALGEWKYGAGQGHHNLLYLTVSTGIGGGVIIDDHLLVGAHGLAAELGHITVMQDGPLCGCGQSGHLESLASGTAVAQWVQQEIAQGVSTSLDPNEKITAKLVSKQAKKGDRLCIAALTRAGYFTGQAIANYLHIFNPSIVVLGGGVSRSGDIFLNPLKKSLKENLMDKQYLDQFELAIAALGDEVGLIGALVLCQTEFHR